MPGLAVSQSLSVVANVADTNAVSTDDAFNNGTLGSNGVVVVGMGGGGGGLCPKAVLVCRPNSHPFQDRTLMLDQAVKVGRSVARARPSPTNAIFDCKVLSRNHALLWYEQGKFYLQDTKSSNGTFVNNQRLSKGSEESLPREVCKYCELHLQGDNYTCSKPPVDFKTKVPFWPGQGRTGQAKAELVF